MKHIISPLTSLRRLIHFLSALLLLLLFTGCKGRSGHADHPDERPTVAVTIEPLRYFAEAIAGPRMQVVTVVPSGNNPETYDPSPAEMLRLNQATAYLQIGHIGFETRWIDKLKKNAPEVKFFDTSVGIDLLTCEAYAHTAHSHHDHQHAIEPHVWTTPSGAAVIARNICEAFCSIDSLGATFYRHRHDSLARCIAHTDSLIRQRLAGSGVKKAFVIYHPTLTYFARDYGLQQLSVEQEGKQPSAAHMKHLMDLCRTGKVGVILSQPQFDVKNLEIIARQTGVPVCSFNPLAYDWQREMMQITDALTGTKN